jgi:succinyl-CoA synthetase beta subunit
LIELPRSAASATDFAKQMIGQTLVTKQTGEKGIEVGKVMVMEKLDLKREMYFSILYDRPSQGPLLVASPAGGTSIEDVAAATPELIFTCPINIKTGPTDAQLTQLAKDLQCEGETAVKCAAIINNLYNMFLACDCTQVEINPLAETANGDVVACDAKLNFDDNAAFRQADIHALRDHTQEDPREVHAAKYDLNYIALHGDIGCVVNGAGLAMATMDIIQLMGGAPANFLDVGGGANEENITEAFRILNDDTNVKAVLVNIFGGIMKCDTIATGIIAAVNNLGFNKPIIIRLEGTNVAIAQQQLKDSGLSETLIVAEDLDSAAATAVKVVAGMK